MLHQIFKSVVSFTDR